MATTSIHNHKGSCGCYDSQKAKEGIYATAVSLAALAVIFGAIILIAQQSNLHLGPFDPVIEFLGKYTFVPLAVSLTVWAILVSAGICKGCAKQTPTQQLPQENFNSVNSFVPSSLHQPTQTHQNLSQANPTVPNILQQSIPQMETFFPNKEEVYQKIDDCLRDNKVDLAWAGYVTYNLTIKSELFPRRERLFDWPISQKSYAYLPPVKLLNAKVDQWLSKGIKITDKICPELIRDCAIQYESFRVRCLQEDRLWICFAGYPEYIADIARACPDFGLHVMTTHRVTTISDHHRMEIFRSSYNNVLQMIETDQFDEEKMKYFVQFLYNHETAIGQTDFDKIQEITRAFKQKKDINGTFFMDYIERKLVSLVF